MDRDRDNAVFPLSDAKVEVSSDLVKWRVVCFAL